MRRRTFLGASVAALLAACTDGSSDSAPPSTTSVPTSSSGTAPPTTAETAPGTTAPTDVGVGWRPVVPATAPFALGVASGEPGVDRVSIWTRLIDDPLGPGRADGPIEVAWTIAADPELAEPVASGSVTTDPARAHAVQVDVEGLEAGRTWWYRFSTAEGESMIGRTRTAPTSPERATIAIASCQRYQDGTYVAHRRLAEADLDLIVFLGDVIYADRGDGDVRAYDGRRPDSLDGYRRRHALYRSDPDLQACLAAHPWIVTRDDNDVANGWGPDHPSRVVAEQALAEHHPMRPDADGDLRRLVSWGDLADIVVLDCRPHRSEPAGRDGPLGATVADDALRSPDRTMLGADQEAWFASTMATSVARWQLVASQVMVGNLSIEVGGDALVNNDQWDGYPAARERLVEALAAAPSPVVLAGDLHSGIVDIVRAGDGAPVATELVSPSISSAVDDRIGTAMEAAALFQPDLLDVRSGVNGWVELTLTADRAEGRIVVMDAADPVAQPGIARTLTIDHGVAEPTLQG